MAKVILRREAIDDLNYIWEYIIELNLKSRKI